MKLAAKAMLNVRGNFAAAHQFEAVSLVEIDAIEALQLLLEEGSPRLCDAIRSIVAQSTEFQAA